MDKDIKKILGGPDLEDEIALLERRLDMLKAEASGDADKKSLKSVQAGLSRLKNQFSKFGEDTDSLHQIVRDHRTAKKLTGSLGDLNKEAYELVNKLEKINAKADVYSEKAASAVLYKLAPELNAMRKDSSAIQTRLDDIEGKFKTLRKQEREQLATMKTSVDEELDKITGKSRELRDNTKVALEEIKTETYKQITDLEDIGRTLDERNEAQLNNIREEMGGLREKLTKENDELSEKNREESAELKELIEKKLGSVDTLINERVAEVDKSLDNRLTILKDTIEKEDNTTRSGLVNRFETLENSVTTDIGKFREKLEKSLDEMNRSLDEVGGQSADNAELIKAEVKENIPYQFIEANERLAKLEALQTDMVSLKQEVETTKKVSNKIANILSRLKSENSIVTVADLSTRLDKIEKNVNKKEPDLEKRLSSIEDKVSLLDVDRILALIEKLSSLKDGLAAAGDKLAGGKLIAKVESINAKMSDLESKAEKMDEFQKTATQLDGALATVREQIVDIKDIIVKGAK